MNYDCVIIGGGLSGLAAGIRLAHYGKKVCLCEQHSRIGGLNSYYSRQGFPLETGLHAMTNFVPASGPKGSPLLKLLRQLRLPHEALQLREQNFSKIVFPDCELSFSNDWSRFENEIAEKFPSEIDGFRRLDSFLMGLDATSLTKERGSARKIVSSYISNPLLEDMLFCPLLYYGSATPDDMDIAQFAIMYRSILREGFCRPGGDGIRVILSLLQQRLEEGGGELRLNCKIRELKYQDRRLTGLIAENGEFIGCSNVLSSAGLVETLALLHNAPEPLPTKPRPGELAFVESIALCGPYLDKFKHDETIVFWNDAEKFRFARPEEAASLHSGVICLPANFRFREGEGTPPPAVRATALANYAKWEGLDKKEYRTLKTMTEKAMIKKAGDILGIPGIIENALLTDTMTPHSIRRYTGHINGAIYGAPEKIKDGRTQIENLFICGTDQGFLGITGAMLSGVTIANQYLLR